MYKGFISYSHADAEICHALHDALGPQRDSVRFWYDRNLRAGDQWKPEIAYHLKNSQIVVFISSPEAFRPNGFISKNELPFVEMLWRGKRLLVITATARPVVLGNLFLKDTELCPDKGRTLASNYSQIDLNEWCAGIAAAIAGRLQEGSLPSLEAHSPKVRDLIGELERRADQLCHAAVASGTPDEAGFELVAQVRGVTAALISPYADFRFDLDAALATFQRELKRLHLSTDLLTAVRQFLDTSQALGKLLAASDYPLPPGFRPGSERSLTPESQIHAAGNMLLDRLQRVEDEAQFLKQHGQPEAMTAARRAEAKVEMSRALLGAEYVDEEGVQKVVRDIEQQTAGLASEVIAPLTRPDLQGLEAAAERFRQAGAGLRLRLAPGDRFRDAPELPELVVIEGGAFAMGASPGDGHAYPDEKPRHETMVRTFAMGAYPVTNAEWHAYSVATGREPDADPPASAPGDHPVVRASYRDALAYCAWASRISGAHYRLPSEAEWEFACRAGTTTPYWFGTEISPAIANVGYESNGTTAVGIFAANPLGLSDMHGNVWEWCQDIWRENYSGDRRGDDGRAGRRVFRGGSWASAPKHARSSNRYGEREDAKARDVGFRVVRNIATGQ